MLFTTHTITGAAIGVAAGNPFWGFTFGFLSHFVLDAIPHFDQGSFYLERKINGPAWLGAELNEKSKKFKVKRDWAMLFIDMAIAVIISAGMVAYQPLYIWLIYGIGATGGLLPDIFDVSPFWKEKFRAAKIGKTFHAVHSFFHWPLSSRYWYIGITTQILIIAAGIYTILKSLN